VPNQSIAIEDGIDLEELRARLRKVTDSELRRFGKARGAPLTLGMPYIFTLIESGRYR
jgi:hypothetical protein